MTPVFTASQSSSLLLLRQETLIFFYVIYDLSRNYSYLSHYMTYNSHMHPKLSLQMYFCDFFYIFIINHQKRSYPHSPAPDWRTAFVLSGSGGNLLSRQTEENISSDINVIVIIDTSKKCEQTNSQMRLNRSKKLICLKNNS